MTVCIHSNDVALPHQHIAVMEERITAESFPLYNSYLNNKRGSNRNASVNPSKAVKYDATMKAHKIWTQYSYNCLFFSHRRCKRTHLICGITTVTVWFYIDQLNALSAFNSWSNTFKYRVSISLGGMLNITLIINGTHIYIHTNNQNTWIMNNSASVKAIYIITNMYIKRWITIHIYIHIYIYIYIYIVCVLVGELWCVYFEYFLRKWPEISTETILWFSVIIHIKSSLLPQA